MYLKQIQIKNTGPIGDFDYSFKFKDDGAPKPLILVGKNGSGKSILLSHVVNSMLVVQSNVFEDSEVEKGRVFKLRSPLYIKAGESFSFSNVVYNNGLSVSEIQLNRPKVEFGEVLDLPKAQGIIWQLGERATSGLHVNIEGKSLPLFPSDVQIKFDDIKNDYSKSVVLFFPPNRFEEPAWLNSENLLNVANYTNMKRIEGFSSRTVIKYHPMKENQNWLLDLLFDLKMYQMKEESTGGFVVRPVDESFLGIVRAVIGLVLRVSPDFQWFIHDRGNRRIVILSDGKIISSSLFALSTGESLLLNMFLSILRDFDMARSGSALFSDIEGAVVVDEIDLHLHADLQHSVLPALIAAFPKVQFIITTHSPLFLMGMKNKFGVDGMDVLNMPDGQFVDVEHFSEFEKTYEIIKTSEKHEVEVKAKVRASQSPVLFVEGETDICYLQKAAMHLDKEDLFKKFRIFDGNGFGSLNQISRAFSLISEVLKHPMVLLYDCDVPISDEKSNKLDRSKSNLFRCSMPLMTRKISKGIENMFPDDLIERAQNAKPAFIDVIGEQYNKIRGELKITPPSWSVNKDEKTNLCKWIIANGTPSDFADFQQVFDMLEDILNTANTAPTPSP